MKLLHCIPEQGGCGDVVRLYAFPRYCHCRLSSGHYVDDTTVRLAGPCRALGIDTGDLLRLDGGTWHVSERVVRGG